MKESSKFPLPTVFQNRDIDPSQSDYNIFFNMLQNHSSVTLFTLCILECLMNIYTKFYLPSVPQLRYGPLTLNIKTRTTSHKIINHDNINSFHLCLKNKNKNAKLYILSMFQTSDIGLLSNKIET